MAAPTLARLLTEQAVDDLADYLTRLPDPDEILALAGLGRADLRRLEGDDEIAAALETRREALVATPWRLEPQSAPAAVWLEAELAPHLHGLLRGAWQAVPYGYSVLEVIWRRAPDGRLGLERLAEKPLEWFEPRRDGSLLWHPPAGEPLAVDTRDKFLLTRRLPTWRQPYGEALLSRLYWPWYFRTNGWQFWARFLERHGGPLLVGKSKNNTLMAQALTAAVQSATLAISRDDEVTAIAPGNAGEAFTAFCASVDRRMQKVILGQTLTTDVGASGSFAAAKVHNEVRDDRRRADIALVSDTVQHLIEALCARNFPTAAVPRFVMADDRGLSSERAARDAQLVQAGVLTFTEQYLLDRFDFEPGDFTIPAPSAGQPGGAADEETEAGVGAGLKPARREKGEKGSVPFSRTPRPPARPPREKGSRGGFETRPYDGFETRPYPFSPAALGAHLMGDPTEMVPPGVRLAAPPPAARFSPGQQAVEDLIAASLGRAGGGPIPAARLRAVIAAASGPEDLVARLARLYDATASTGGFETRRTGGFETHRTGGFETHRTGGFETHPYWQALVEQALFTADVLGYRNAETGQD
jgi:hypothetical protein